MPYYMTQRVSSEGLPTVRYYRKADKQPGSSKAERAAFAAAAAAKYAAMNGIDVAALKMEKVQVMLKPDSGEEI